VAAVAEELKPAYLIAGSDGADQPRQVRSRVTKRDQAKRLAEVRIDDS
jgi:hypothetical protein